MSYLTNSNNFFRVGPKKRINRCTLNGVLVNPALDTKTKGVIYFFCRFWSCSGCWESNERDRAEVPTLAEE